jgi:diacylglycerol O-acyltransferase-1
MATAVDTSTVTSTDLNAVLTNRSVISKTEIKPNGSTIETTVEEVEKTPDARRRVRIKRKYRHVAAVHSVAQTSCLSHDAEAIPSFVGFRNLMVIVLGMYANITKEASSNLFS